MKEISMIVNLKVRVNFYGKMVTFMMGIGVITRGKEKENLFFQMEISMKEISKVTFKVVKEY